MPCRDRLPLPHSHSGDVQHRPRHWPPPEQWGSWHRGSPDAEARVHSIRAV